MKKIGQTVQFNCDKCGLGACYTSTPTDSRKPLGERSYTCTGRNEGGCGITYSNAGFDSRQCLVVVYALKSHEVAKARQSY